MYRADPVMCAIGADLVKSNCFPILPFTVAPPICPTFWQV